MMLIWFMLVLNARRSGSDEIPLLLERAEQSSNYDAKWTADKAIDNDLATASQTGKGLQPWLRIYFKSSSKSTVGKVVIEKGEGHSPACLVTVFVYDGEAGTVCGTGTYTGKNG